MSEAKRVKLSPGHSREMWWRWKAGQSQHEIGRALGRAHSSIHLWLLTHGGIPPAARRRSRRALTLGEREDISRGIASGSSIPDIARNLDRRQQREIERRLSKETDQADSGLPVPREIEQAPSYSPGEESKS